MYLYSFLDFYLIVHHFFLSVRKKRKAKKEVEGNSRRDSVVNESN